MIFGYSMIFIELSSINLNKSLNLYNGGEKVYDQS